MERIRRIDTAAGNGPPSRRRHRTASLRDSPDGPTELQETVQLRDRAMRRERDRDRDLLDRDKRRRVERFVRASNREGGGGEESTEESVGGEEDDRTENRGSHSNHSQRKSSLSATVTRPSESMAIDEIVGVAVPRKARSSSVKRSHEYLVSGNVSTSRRSGDSISPPNSTLSVGKKMKGTLNVSKSSSQSRENIEIEIAEVLYGLMKQSQSSKKESFVPNSSQKLESDHSNGVVGSEQPTKREASLQNLTGEKCEASVQVASLSMEIQKEVAEQDSSSRMAIESSRVGDGIGSVETIVMEKEESPSGPKLNNDLQDLTMTKGTSLGDRTQQEKINSNSKKQSKETLVGQEVVVKVEETKMKSTQEKRKWLTFDLEKEDQDRTRDDENVGSSKEQKQRKQAEPTNPKKEKSDPPPSSSALTNNRPHWASSLPPLGSTAISIDGNTETSKALQDPHCPLSQPRAKRCTTHHHIARNIYLHQQFLETNKFRLAPAGSASMFDTTPCNLSLMLPPNPLQGVCVSANVNSTHGQGNTPGCSEKGKSFGVATNLNDDNVTRKQLVFQQTLQPAMVGNLQHGPALFIHTGQNQAAGATAAPQPGVSKSITSINNPPSSTNTSAARNLPASTPLPAGAATMSFSYPVIAANEAPCLAMLPNNGYPIPAPAFLGATPAQAMPYFNGPFYSPQMFHPSQLQQQQPPHSQASSGSSSSSVKKLQPWGSQNKANNIKQTLNPQSSIELVPQAFTVSFASPNGNPVAPNISFSSVAQNPALFHNLPHSNQVVAAGQMVQQRHYKEGKESKPAASGQTHLFDNSARTLNFMASPVIGNWSSRSTAVTSASSPVSANSPNSRQQHPLQLQKQHVPASMSSNHVASASTKFQSNSPNSQLLHLQKQQSAPTSSNLAASIPSSPMIFSQAPNQNYSFGQSQSPHWKANSARNSAPNIVSSGQNQNSARNYASNMASLGQNQNSAGNYASNMASSSQNQNPARSSTSKMASSLNQIQNPAGNYASNMVSSDQNPNSARNYASGMASSGQNQISFAGATITCPPMEENGSSNLRTASTGSTKTGSSAPALQQIDNSTTTRTQKSSPVCGRNVPSILMSPPPNHLSELKH